MSDDYSADRFTTGAVAVGGSTTGTIETAYDEDWFAVELVAGRTYRFDLEGSPTGRGTLPDTYLRAIYDSEGRYQSRTYNDNFDGSRNSRVTFTAEESGTYYVRASGDRDEIGEYTLSVRDVTPPEADDPPPADPPADTAAAVAESETETDQNQAVPASVSEGATDLPNDNSTPGRVAVGGSATGTIGRARDNDRFAVELEAGRTYQFDLEGSPGGGGTLPDTYFRAIYNSEGRYESGSYNDDFGGSRDSRVTFTAQESGTYYARVSGDRNETGTYTLTVTDMTPPETGGSTTNPVIPEPQEPTVEVVGPDQDAQQQPETSEAQGEQESVSEGDTDLPADTTTPGRVVVGGSATGAIGTPVDEDWFAVDLEAGKAYRLDLKGFDTDDGTLTDPYLRGIHNADGEPIANTSDDDGGTAYNSRVFFAPSKDATYYVAARAYGAHADRVGTYTLSVTEVEDDYAADPDPDTTGTVVVGDSATGTIEALGDQDWFAVELEAGTTYHFDLKGSPTGDGTLTDPYLRGIYDADRVLSANTTNDDDGEGRNSRVLFTPDEEATYYVAAGADGTHYGTYTLSVTEVADDYTAEPDPDTTGTVAVGESVTGNVNYFFDGDWFAVELEAGTTYRFDLKGSRTNDGTLADPYLRGIYDADGERIANTVNNDGGKGYNSRVYFTPDEDATYYVAAAAYDYGVGTYTLSVTEPSDDYSADPGTTGRVAAVGSATGRIESPGDEDWFRVSLEEGKTYQLDLKGTSRDYGGTLPDPHLRGIYDADGVLMNDTTDDNSGRGSNSRVHFTPDGDAAFYVAVAGTHDAVGTYTLSVREIAGDDYPADRTTTGTVAVGSPAAGNIELPDDRDWFRVALEAGKTYQFDLEESRTGDGTLADPYLHGIYGSDGRRITNTTDDDGGEGDNSRVTFTADADGAYYVAAGAYRPSAGQGAYTLSVVEVPDGDDYTSGIHTTGRVAVGTSATGAVDFARDIDWFRVTLEAGNTYRFDLEGTQHPATLLDPYLYGIHDADGVLIAGTTNNDIIPIHLQSRPWNFDSRATFTADADGTYYVAAGGRGVYEGRYSLSVTHATDDFLADLADGPATTGTVDIGGSVGGNIAPPRDEDWFAVDLEAGTAYRFDLEGSPTGRGTLVDPYLRGIHDSDGVLIANTTNDDDGEGRNSRVFFTPDEEATYYVAAGAFGNRFGTYTLSVEEVVDGM